MASVKVIIRTTKRLFSQKSAVYKSFNSQNVWSHDNIVKSPFRDVEIPNITVPELIWQNLDKWADKPAMVCGITNRSYTYHQTYKYSLNFAARLRSKLSFRDGDVVCIMMPNSPEYGIAALGVLQAGGEVTPVNPIYTAHEVSRQFLLTKPKVIIGTSTTISAIKEALKLVKKDIPIVAVRSNDEGTPPGTVSFEEFALDNNVDHTVLNEVNRRPEDKAFLPCSSGTTGLPKGVELLHRNIVANLAQLNAEKMKHHSDTTSASQDSLLAVVPFYHIYGLTIVLLHKLAVGQKLVTLPNFHPSTFLTAMKEHRINLLPAAPPLVVFCVSHKDVSKEHLGHLKVMTSGAAPLSIHDVHRFLDKCPPGTNYVQLYGMTEASPLATSTVPGEDNYASVGYAVANSELRVVDPEMRSLGPNELGELLIRGPHVMKGYRNNPEATKDTITEDGWLKSGDLVKIDEQGAVTVADRIKELIKVKGYQVPPAELENLLKEHPGIADATVVGIPDDKQGEVPKAFIVVKEGYNLNTDDLKKFVDERVAPYKRVKEFMFLEAIPKNAAGKILRRVVRETYC